MIGQAVKAAQTTDLASPDALVTTGSYAVSRNPMYVGWALLQVGIGLITRSGWVIATLPAVGLAQHREVLREEQRLEDRFGDEYRQYAAKVGRYLQ